MGGDGHDDQGSEIAVVGMACRFPGARDVAGFWRNLRGGIESLTPLADEELLRNDVDAALLRHPHYVKAAQVIADADRFDAAFFGYNALEARLMDPQQRVFLECCWHALEDAGCDPARHRGRIGVYAGSKTNTYLFHLASRPELLRGLDFLQLVLTGDQALLSTRISYKLDLRGPSYAVQTACSSSLVAVHLACQSLLLDECQMALAGGVAILVPDRVGYLYEAGNILSPDGHCRPFDAAAQGTVFGSGVGAVVLKRLQDALADGDPIRAVIRGSATNNDGAVKASFTAPSVEGQAAVVLEALAAAGVEPGSISYVEGHGTGTPLGDPIEVQALTQAFRAGTARRGFCALGSVKSNVGHLDAAAGMASLIKTILALEHGEIPPTLHYAAPNPAIDFAAGPFYVADRLRSWRPEGPRRAGVSSFGFGGTNAHLILEEAPPRRARQGAPPPAWQLLALSARTPEALEEATARLADHLEAHPEIDLADAAHTLRSGRQALAHRRVAVVQQAAAGADHRAAVAVLRSGDGQDVVTGARHATAAAVGLLFSGQGAQVPGMGRELYAMEPVFRRELDRCAEVLRLLLGGGGLDLVAALYPMAAEGRAEKAEDRAAEAAAARLERTELAQPALFAVEWALARLWMHWGVRPHAVAGHSIGEYTAACLAGVFELEDALALVADRGRLMQEMPPGAMLAVALAEEALVPRLAGGLALAAVNGPADCVVSGPLAEVAALAGELAAQGIKVRRLHTSHAFHSPMMEPAVARFAERVRGVRLQPPRLPCASNLTGGWLTAEQATDPEHWARHLRGTVRFADNLAGMLASCGALLEVGPGTALATLARRHPARGKGHLVLSSLPHADDRRPEAACLLAALARLWTAGAELDPEAWDVFHAGETRRRVPLPGYPFVRDRHWIDAPAAAGRGDALPAGDRIEAPAGAGRGDALPEGGGDALAPGGIDARAAADQVNAPGAGRGDALAAGRGDAPAAPGRIDSGRARVSLDRIPDLGDWFYVPAWRPAELPAAAAGRGAAAGPWLLFADEAGVGERLAARLRAAGAEVALATAGEGFAAGADGRFTIAAAGAADYDRLLDAMAARGRLPAGIVHLWSLTAPPSAEAGEAAGEAAVRRGFWSLLHLFQALGRRAPGGPVSVVVVSNGVQAATGDEPLAPEKAALLGPCKVIGKESAAIGCRSVDLDASAAEVAASEAWIERLAAEAAAGAGPAEPAVAWRGGQRLAETFAALRCGPVDPAAAPLRERGVYLITGGLGGIGLVLAESLARAVRARLVLIGRTGLPPREQWQERLREGGAAAGRIRRVLALEELGAEVLPLAADVADEVRMAEVVELARRRFGALHGAVHAAGLAGGGLLGVRRPEAAAAVLAPKLRGARVLARVLGPGVAGGAGLDFLLFVSSLQTVLADFGQVDYVAANAFLDAFACALRAGGAPALSVDWDNWREVGLLAEATMPAHLRPWQEELLAKAIAPAEGAETFRRLLAVARPRVAVSTQDLPARIELAAAFAGGRILAELGLAPPSPPPPAGPGRRPEAGAAAPRPLAGELERRVRDVWQQVLPAASVGPHDNFFDLGGNSLTGMQLIGELNRELGCELAPAQLYDAPTVSALARLLAAEPRRAETAAPAPAAALGIAPAGEDDHGWGIAVIGMAGRFPGAANLGELWRNLRGGVESIRSFAGEELRAAGVAAERIADPRYVKARAVLDGVDQFAADFFGVPPREAEIMDPQHRLFLECAWEALEDAGYGDAAASGAVIGVYAGSNISSYLQNLYSNPAVLAAVGELQAMLANEKDSLPVRVSYKLGLTGPSLAVQTYCSTSLVAVHLACRALLAGECDMALAGGVAVTLPQTSGYLHDEGSFASGDGHVRAFDAAAQGIVPGNGLGVVVLKPLARALADGDCIRAVIRGSAINNDGALKAGFLAPSGEGQVAVVQAALRTARCHPESIGYVECHGTATPLGDPIEVGALARAWQAWTGRKGFCPIGSVKTNFGHLDRAAGVASLIKTVLALEHGEIPASLHFEAPNPQIDFAASPFYVNARLAPWPRQQQPRRAAVSALGVGGTNAHLIVEEAPPRPPAGDSRPWQLLVLSAQTPAALDAAAANLAAHLAAYPGLALADAAFTLQVGRRAFACRRAVICREAEEASAALSGATSGGDPGRVAQSGGGPARPATSGGDPGRPAPSGGDPCRIAFGVSGDEPPSPVFLFPGLGAQYVDMARGLYRGEPAFRAALDRCRELFAAHLGTDLGEVLYPHGTDGDAASLSSSSPSSSSAAASAAGLDLRRMLGRGGEPQDETAARLDQTLLSQPAIFAVEYALARLWLDWGIEPQAMAGYSVGELTAACLAGVLTLEDAAALAARRARLIDELPPGAMTAVPLAAERAAALLGDDLSLAGINGPNQSVVAGPLAAVAAFEDRLDGMGLICRRLQTAHAFHSRMLAPACGALVELVRGFELRPPAIPYLSNVTGTWITAAEATDPAYWARHMVQPVRFGDIAAELLRDPARAYLEIGPGQTLTSLVLQHPGSGAAADGRTPLALASLRPAYETVSDQAFLLHALGRFWTAGGRVDWQRFSAGQRRRRVPLPTYPFERRRYWIEAAAALPAAAAAAARPPAPDPAQPSTAAEASIADAGPAAPRDERERRIAAIWQELLGRRRVGIHDNFLDVGGDSLLAYRLVSRLRDELGVQLPVRLVFQGSTVADLAREAGRLLDEAAAAAGAPAGPGAAIPRRDRGAPAPLSLAQERLWFLDQLNPGNPAYNVPVMVRLAGRLDTAVLARAFAAIARRHQILRSRFVAAPGGPVQEIAPAVELPLPVVDLGSLPATERERRVLALAAAHTRAPFDLGRAPLLRIVLLRLAAEEHVVVLAVHHVVSDQWSINILVRELGALYEAFAAGRAGSLPAAEIQYADFAAWQRRWLREAALADDLEFWQRALAGAPAALDLPTDRPRPAVQRFRGAKRFVAFAPALLAELKSLGRRAEASLFMTLLAVLYTLLHRVTGQDDVVVGSPVANRLRPELEGVVGPLLNNLLLRGDLAGNPPFQQLLARVRDAAIAAFEHQDLPFERLLEELQPERTMSRNALFQVMLVLQTAPRGELRAPGLTFTPLDVDAGTVQLDLTLQLVETREGLTGWLAYDVDLFHAPTAERLVGHYRNLLAAVGRDPAIRLRELPLLSAAELHQVTAAWNDTGAGYARDRTVHGLVAAQAARIPDAPAAWCGAEWLTYGELERRANRLAWRLIALGVGGGCPVGLHLGRGLHDLVALLGILEAGGAYVPIDIGQPAARIAAIVRVAGIACLVSERAQESAVRGLAGLLRHVIWLDEPGAWLDEPGALAAPSSAGPPPPRAGAETLAYVIFTSGSTGTPKGVMVRHRPVVNLVEWVHRTFDVGREDRLLFTTALSFDLSVYDVFGTLAAGGAIRLAAEAELAEPEALVRILREEPVTFWDSAPAALQQLVPFLPAEPVPWAPLRLVFLSGDWIPVTLPGRMRAAFPGARVIALGGATEATVWSNWFPVREVPRWWASVPYGRPIQNARYYVLDPELRPLPIGVPGDLFIGGECLSAGYLGRPDGTADQYLPDPFAGAPGARLYRTGDRARFWPDGNLEFLGRRDHQVKIRGYRIELGEIQAALAQHPAVREAAVLARDEAGGGKRLVAWFAARPGEAPPPTAAALRAWVQERLPAYMVPAAFVEVEALPVTANGKLDRQALPAPGGARAGEGAAAAGAAPRTPAEEVLAAIWAEILAVERVGVRDDLFELGAHSLLATQVVSRIRETLGVEMPLRVLFEQPTVAGQAERVAAAQASQAGVQLPPVVPVPRQGKLPLSFTQERMWFLQQMTPAMSAYNSPGAVLLEGEVKVSAMAAAVRGILARHEVFRTSYPAVNGEPRQVIAPRVAFALPLLDLSALPAAERRRRSLELVAREARRPFDLARGPLLRVYLMRFGPREHMLGVVTHHIVYDMWAREVFIRELAQLYAASAAGQPSPRPAGSAGNGEFAGLAELPVQYADFAVWQRTWMRGEVLAGQLAYWRGKLASAPPATELPGDRPRPAVQTFPGDRAYMLVPPALARTVEALARREGATVFMVLLAAWKAVLARLLGQDGIVLGMPIANRNRVELEGLIGFFANSLVLYTDLGGNPAFRAALAAVRETALGSYTHQDMPFEALVQELAPPRDLARTPLFQIMFNYLPNYALQPMAVPGLQLTAQEVHNSGAPFDLDVNLWATREGYRGAADYNTDLFDRVTILRLTRCFTTLLAGAAADPDLPLSELPLLPESERHQVLRESNDAAAEVPGATWQELFAAQATRTPEAVAVACQGEELTYAELARRAGQVAAGLAARGVGPEVLVALLAPRGLDFAAAVLGVLAAGGAWLPLAPRQPPRRHLQVLEQSRAPVLLTTAELRPFIAEALDLLPAGHRPEVLLDVEGLLGPAAAGRRPGGPGAPPCRDEPAAPPEGGGGRAGAFAASCPGSGAGAFADPYAGPGAGGWRHASPRSLAYVIYTSGSTGVPKGAMIEQRGMLNHLLAKIRALRLSAADRVAQNAAQTFDVSVWQLLAALLVGGAVEILPDEVADDPQRLLAAAASGRITVLETVPSLLRVLLEEAGGAPARRELRHLRWMLATGEALPPEICRAWFDRYPGIALLNAYGPTECSDDVSHHEIRQWPEHEIRQGPEHEIRQWPEQEIRRRPAPAAAGASPPPQRVPIGRPIGNLRLHVVDRGLGPLPIGVPGELVVGGAGVGRGYLGEPARTAESFVPDPWAEEGGARLYRTGDLARLLPGGALDLLGRLDHQVKVRGFRIEPGEIEAVLAEHPGVRQAVVVTRELPGRPGDARLVAYVVAQEEASPPPEELRALAAERLPDAMVPAVVVVLPTLPLTAHGKIDRRALPAPEAAPVPERGRYVAPRNPLEQELAGIWASLLGVEAVGVDDDFFHLGGHSLLAARVVSRVRTAFGVELPLATFFAASTVGALAEAISVAQWAVEAARPEAVLAEGEGQEVWEL
jgi:amino acid adenylation domain-containing protein